MLRRFGSLAAVLALIVFACGGSETAETTTSTTSESTTTTTTPVAASTTSQPPATTTTVTETPPDEELPDDIEETDWLNIANGLIISSSAGDAPADTASVAIRAVDGAANQIGFTNDGAQAAVYVFELPATTTFDRFAVPDTRDSPGNTTFFGSIEIAGSAVSATDGFEVLVSEDFEELPADLEVAEFIPVAQPAVRWIRLSLSGTLELDPEHGTGNTVVRFSELIGNGVQETVALSEAFNGVWSLRFADNPDGAGDLTELKQVGATVAGCIGFADVTGTVAGNVVRLNGIDTRDQRPSVYLLIVNPDGELQGVESTRGGVFRARVGPTLPDGTETPCSETTPAPLACGSVVYVNFDVNSATIRPDSEQVLQDLFAGLSSLDDTEVTIEGHTSTEGSTEYNLDLSKRRAQAVVDNLVSKGLPDEQLVSVGKGESEPLVSETDEASRAINRRVEIECG